MISVIQSRISRDDCKDGFILDGFPRTIEQGQALEKVLPDSVDVVLYLNVPSEIVVERLAGRLTCRKCGSVFPPMDATECPNCGGELYQRDDDKRSTIENRLRVYEENTAPLVEFYRERGKLIEIDGTGDVEEIKHRIESGVAQVKT